MNTFISNDHKHEPELKPWMVRVCAAAGIEAPRSATGRQGTGEVGVDGGGDDAVFNLHLAKGTVLGTVSPLDGL